MPLLFPEAVDLRNGAVREPPSALKAAYAAGKQHEDGVHLILLFLLALALTTLLLGFYIRGKFRSAGNAQTQNPENRVSQGGRGDALLNMEEGRLPAQAAGPEAAAPEAAGPEVDRDEVTELESVGWMLYSRECLRQHRRGRNQELRREVRQAQRPVADVEDPTAFEDGPPSEAEGDRPFGDDDGWETFSASALRSASLPDWAMAEEDAGASASNTSESYSAGSGA